MIPKIIWQTYETTFSNLPQYAKTCANTWKDLNPEYKYLYMSAEDRECFVKENFDDDWYQIFMSCPLGIMRSNIWRYKANSFCKTKMKFIKSIDEINGEKKYSSEYVNEYGNSADEARACAKMQVS